MYLNYIWIKNGSVFVLEIYSCICIEISKSNVCVFEFDLAELYFIPKCVFEPNTTWQWPQLLFAQSQRMD